VLVAVAAAAGRDDVGLVAGVADLGPLRGVRVRAQARVRLVDLGGLLLAGERHDVLLVVRRARRPRAALDARAAGLQRLLLALPLRRVGDRALADHRVVDLRAVALTAERHDVALVVVGRRAPGALVRTRAAGVVRRRRLRADGPP